MPKPRFEQYEAQTAGVMLSELVEAPVRARPFEPSATRPSEADRKPTGRVPTLPEAAAEDEAAGAAELADEAGAAPAIGLRSALSSELS